MNKTPIFWRGLFALSVVVVFVYSMFPLTETDYYESLKQLVSNPDDSRITALIEGAKQKQKDDPFTYSSPSKALEAVANEAEQPVNLLEFLPKQVKDRQSLKNNGDVLNLARKNAAGAISLGIDLNGGAEFLLELKPSKNKDTSANFEKYRDNAIETLRKRLEKQGFYECDISPAGGNLISVRVPVVTEDSKASIEKLILRSAILEFRLVYPDQGQKLSDIREAYITAKDSMGGNLSLEDFYNRIYLPQHGDLAGYELLKSESIDQNGARSFEYELVAKKVEMYGDQIKDAGVGTRPLSHQLEIQLSFTNEGAQQFGQVTEANVGRRLAIVLDGQLYSAPNLNEPIWGGNASISGNFSQDEAKEVADALVSGSLPFEIEIQSRSDIDPTVGAETIRKSIWSGIIGTILVMIFMIIYYRVAGVVANISLLVNAVVMVGAIAALNVTLTLPGIAGIILTLGMAVDANVLIYERIREEINNGKSVANAVQIGFDRAFSAIFDSNLTTLFVALILFWQGSGTIKGFAITLAIGIFTTLFTAVFLTRILFDVILRIAGNRIKNLSMLAFLRDPRIDFIRIGRTMVIISIVAVVGSLGLMAYKGKDMLGIDFTGGTQLLVDYKPKTESAGNITPAEIEQYLRGKGYDAKASYKITTDREDNGVKLLEVIVRPQNDSSAKDEVSDEVANNIVAEMDTNFPDVEFTPHSKSTLGALIGEAFTWSAVKALVLAMIGMIIYMIIRFQFSYSIAANIALIHDAVVSMGIYVACGGQLTLQVVAGLLTLIGYSVNDTIVIFDRQRENLTLMGGKSYFDVVNTSVNQTLGRTILTSVSVALILIAQLLFGGEGIRDFVAVMLIGCLVGCYSSTFISPYITAHWHKRERDISEGYGNNNTAALPEEKA